MLELTEATRPTKFLSTSPEKDAPAVMRMSSGNMGKLELT